MFLILSGEGSSDIGIEDKAIGPMTKLIDRWIAQRIGYSLIEGEQYAIFSEAQVVEKAKYEIRSYSRIGKKRGKRHEHFIKMLAG